MIVDGRTDLVCSVCVNRVRANASMNESAAEATETFDLELLGA